VRGTEGQSSRRRAPASRRRQSGEQVRERRLPGGNVDEHAAKGPDVGRLAVPVLPHHLLTRAGGGAVHGSQTLFGPRWAHFSSNTREPYGAACPRPLSAPLGPSPLLSAPPGSSRLLSAPPGSARLLPASSRPPFGSSRPSLGSSRLLSAPLVATLGHLSPLSPPLCLAAHLGRHVEWRARHRHRHRRRLGEAGRAPGQDVARRPKVGHLGRHLRPLEQHVAYRPCSVGRVGPCPRRTGPAPSRVVVARLEVAVQHAVLMEVVHT